MPRPESASAIVIVNAGAGSGHTAEWAATLAEKFAAHGITASVKLAKNGSEILAAAEAAVASGAKLVVAGGGDGTQNAVASKLVGQNVAMGILPLGTLNHFARDLGIPNNLDAAVQTIGTLNHRQVDVAEVNGNIFVNNSSLGLYPDIVRHREQQQKQLGRSKWTAFSWALLTAIRRYPFLNLSIRVDDQLHQRRTAFIFVGNNAYQMEGFQIGERQRLDGGVLSFYVTNRSGRLALMRLMLRALVGRLHQATDFDAVSATEVLIETRRQRLRVSTDGEVRMMTAPLRYRIRPGALTVIAPAAPVAAAKEA